MTSVNERFRQVVNLAGQVSELNTAELECGTLKTSSLLANSLRSPLPNDGVVRTVNYSLTSDTTESPNKEGVKLSLSDPPSDPVLAENLAKELFPLSEDSVILSVSMIVTYSDSGTSLSGGVTLFANTDVEIIDIASAPTETITANNMGGVLGEKITPFVIGDGITLTHNAPTGTGTVTVSGTVTYFEPSE